MDAIASKFAIPISIGKNILVVDEVKVLTYEKIVANTKKP